MGVTMSVDLAGLDAMIDHLATDVEAAVRPAAQAAAQVLYDEAMRNVLRLGSVTGKLRASIYQAYSKANSGPGVATYHVSWNARKAPHGHLVEYGHIQRYRTYVGTDGKWYTDTRHPLAVPRQVAAQPFMRPAAAKAAEASAAAEAKLLEVLGAV